MVRLPLGSFAWQTANEEAMRAGLTIEELITFSLLYYLADRDSGRISRHIADSPSGELHRRRERRISERRHPGERLTAGEDT